MAKDKCICWVSIGNLCTQFEREWDQKYFRDDRFFASFLCWSWRSLSLPLFPLLRNLWNGRECCIDVRILPTRPKHNLSLSQSLIDNCTELLDLAIADSGNRVLPEITSVHLRSHHDPPFETWTLNRVCNITETSISVFSSPPPSDGGLQAVGWQKLLALPTPLAALCLTLSVSKCEKGEFAVR